MTVFYVERVKASNLASRAAYYEGQQEEQRGYDDYYLQAGSDTMSARFVGGAIGTAGIKEGQEPQAGDYEKLFNGKRLDNGEFFINESKQKELANEKKESVHGYSTCFSVDKSISLLYAKADKEQQAAILKALSDATNDVVNYAEQSGKFVVGKGQGRKDGHEKANVMAASYTHVTSRQVGENLPDPQLHVHLEIANFAVTESGQIKALDAYESLYKRQSQYRALYDVALFRRLQEAGIQTHTFENDFSGYGLKTVSVNDDQIDEFSKRRNQINEALEGTGHSSIASKKIVGLETRSAKKAILDYEKLDTFWKEEIGEIDLETSAKREPPTKLQVEDVLFKGHSVVSADDLDRAAYQLAIGDPRGLASLDIYKQQIISELDIIHCKDTDYITTKEFVEVESELLRYAIRQQHNNTHNVDWLDIQKGIQRFQDAKTEENKAKGVDQEFILNDEQAAAVYHLAENTGGFAIMQGAAGTGKSATLGAVQEVYKDKGYTVLGTAPTNKAVSGLRDDGIDAMSLQKLIIDYQDQKLKIDNKTLLMVDEAGMADTRTLHTIASIAESTGAKVILTGDAKQLESVGSASSFEMLSREEAAGNAELQIIARQNHKEDRAIATAWLKGKPGQAWEMSKARGQVTACGELKRDEQELDPEQKLEKNAEAMKGMNRREDVSAADLCADSYLADLRKEEARGGSGAKTLMLADTREDVAGLNKRVRDARIDAEEVDADKEMVFHFDGDSKKGRKEYIAPGDRVMFRKGDPKMGVDNGTTGRVLDTATQLDDDGNTLHGLLVQPDRPGSKPTFVSQNYTGLQVAYATTVHKSQGMTVNDSHYLASDMAGRRGLYVAGTRAKENHYAYLDASKAEKIHKGVQSFTSKTCALDAVDGFNPVVEQELLLSPTTQSSEAERAQANDETRAMLSCVAGDDIEARNKAYQDAIMRKATEAPRYGVFEQIEKSGTPFAMPEKSLIDPEDSQHFAHAPKTEGSKQEQLQTAKPEASDPTLVSTPEAPVASSEALAGFFALASGKDPRDVQTQAETAQAGTEATQPPSQDENKTTEVKQSDQGDDETKKKHDRLARQGQSAQIARESKKTRKDAPPLLGSEQIDVADPEPQAEPELQPEPAFDAQARALEIIKMPTAGERSAEFRAAMLSLDDDDFYALDVELEPLMFGLNGKLTEKGQQLRNEFMPPDNALQRAERLQGEQTTKTCGWTPGNNGGPRF